MTSYDRHGYHCLSQGTVHWRPATIITSSRLSILIVDSRRSLNELYAISNCFIMVSIIRVARPMILMNRRWRWCFLFMCCCSLGQCRLHHDQSKNRNTKTLQQWHGRYQPCRFSGAASEPWYAKTGFHVTWSSHIYRRVHVILAVLAFLF